MRSKAESAECGETSQAFPANSQLLGQRSLELGQRLTRQENTEDTGGPRGGGEERHVAGLLR